MIALTERGCNVDNVMKFPDINQIKDEASVWVVKLHGFTYKTGEPIPAEQAAALRDWLAQSDQHHEAFLAMLSGWDAMAMLEDLADILPLSDSLYDQGNAPQRAGWLQKWSWSWVSQLGNSLGVVRSKMHLAYSGAVVCAVALMMFFIIQPQDDERYITRVGEQATYSLADGSVLTLNTDTEVEVNYSKGKRSIILHHGEAGFDVAKNKERPFVVYAGKGMVWAVGTAFNINHRQAYVDVIVSEGTVKVFSGITPKDSAPLMLADEVVQSILDPAIESPDAQSHAPQSHAPQNHAPQGYGEREVILVAGEAAQYKETIISKESLQAPLLDKKLSWQRGSLFFQGETLEQAMLEIARYTDQHLVIIDASIRDTRVGGRFKTDDINGLLQSLVKSLNIKMEEGEGSQLLFSAK